jgi:hypothetical protein
MEIRTRICKKKESKERLNEKQKFTAALTGCYAKPTENAEKRRSYLEKALIYASQRALSTFAPIRALGIFDLESAQGLRRPRFCLIYGNARSERIKFECSLGPNPPAPFPKWKGERAMGCVGFSWKKIIQIRFNSSLKPIQLRFNPPRGRNGPKPLYTIS